MENPLRGENLKSYAVEASNNRQRFRKHQEADSLKRNEHDLPSEWKHSGDNQLRKDHSSPGAKQEFFSVRRQGESPNLKTMRPDASSHWKGFEYPENVDVPLHRRPDYQDHFAPTSSKSEVTTVTPSIRNNDDCDHDGNNSVGRDKREGDRSYIDNFASTSSKSKVKVTPFALKSSGGNHNNANSLARVKSEGDRPYTDTFAATSSKCEIKVTSSVRSNDVNKNSYNPVTRVKSDGDRSYYNFALPPPYVKPNVKAKDGSCKANSESTPAIPNFSAIPKSPAVHERTNADQRLENVQKGVCYPEKAIEDVGPARGNSHVNEKDNYKHQDEAKGFPLAKPRSSRRRYSKSQSAHDDACDDDEDAGVGKRSSRSRRKDDHRRGLQILFDDERSQKDEEERMIDKLLIHYSKKPSTYEGGKVKRKSRSQHHDDVGPGLGEPPLSRQAEIQGLDEEFGAIPPPRSVSLPREQPSAPPEPAKVFTRAATFQLDRSNAAKHVHPKLPNYDDLAARFAALKGGK